MPRGDCSTPGLRNPNLAVISVQKKKKKSVVDAIVSLVKQTAELSLQTQKSTHAMVKAIAKNQGMQRAYFQQRFRDRLFAANGTEINTYRTKILILDLGLRRPFKWEFIVTQVKNPILGADFPKHYSLLVDIRNRRLLDHATNLQANAIVAKKSASAISTINADNPYQELLRKYVDITKPRSSQGCPHDIQYHIEVKGPPVSEPPRRLPPDKLKAAKKKFEHMMQQGICRPSNSPWASPQHLRFMDTMLKGLDLGDTFIASRDEKKHEDHLKQVFDRLLKYGYKINVAKCIFGKKEIEYLGYHISSKGIKPLTERIEAIQQFSKPKTIEDLRRFLGLINFYRHFIKDAAKVQTPFKREKRDKRLIKWTDEAERAFDSSKKQVAEATLLVYPIEGAPLALKTDASDNAIGTALEQWNGTEWQPLGFFSKEFSESEKNYSTYDRELTAIYRSVQFFKNQIEG
ncbi:uncharacterized protein LOC143265517 [Megachile rotundata]|uniref:uncharacterized protein LOC143265517 n=1 Tax=Megachile rotundata TaxID=143995 RepID=UPI003FD16BA1